MTAVTTTDRPQRGLAGLRDSPLVLARTAGAFYAITVVTSLLAFFPGRGSAIGHATNLLAGASYLVATVLLYELLKPVNATVSLLAALFSVVGISHGEDGIFYFGFYCIVLGYLIFESTFLPRAIGVLMTLAGLGLLANNLSNLFPASFAHAISTVGFSLDGIGEIPLTLWLLVVGADVAKWHEKANRSVR